MYKPHWNRILILWEAERYHAALMWSWWEYNIVLCTIGGYSTSTKNNGIDGAACQTHTSRTHVLNFSSWVRFLLFLVCVPCLLSWIVQGFYCHIVRLVYTAHDASNGFFVLNIRGMLGLFVLNGDTINLALTKLSRLVRMGNNLFKFLSMQCPNNTRSMSLLYTINIKRMDTIDIRM